MGHFADNSSHIFLLFLGKVKPFRVGVHFDHYEDCANAAETEILCEFDVTATTVASGTLGFKLTYWQQSC